MGAGSSSSICSSNGAIAIYDRIREHAIKSVVGTALMVSYGAPSIVFVGESHGRQCSPGLVCTFLDAAPACARARLLLH
jgi:hypothetical protein